MKHIYKWLTGLLLFFSGSIAVAQNISLNFKSSCGYSTQCNPFLNSYGCTQSIVIRATHGSPRFAADSTIEMRASLTSNGQQLSEGLTIAYLFKANKLYTIKLKYKGIPSTQLVTYPYLYAGFTNNPPRYNDNCGLGPLTSIDMDYPTNFTVSKNEATSSFDFTPGKDYFNLWLLTYPLQFDETGLLLISLEIVDKGAPPTNTCYTDATFNFCDPGKVWNGSVDVRASNPLSLSCDAFKTSSQPAAGAAFVRRFTAPSIRLTPGFDAYAADPAGAVRSLRILPSADPCNQALRVAASPISNIQTVTSTTQLLENINIYPSPSRGLVNIDFNSSDLLNAQISVTDQSGRVVYQMRNKVKNNLVQLNLEHLSNGIYFIKVNMKNKVAVKKLLITK
jgi:hypothetical protein